MKNDPVMAGSPLYSISHITSTSGAMPIARLNQMRPSAMRERTFRDVDTAWGPVMGSGSVRVGCQAVSGGAA